MRVSSAAIFTLATLTASNVTQQAIAAPSNVPTQGENVNNVVVPTAEETPLPSEAIAKPENIVIEQFSQTPGTSGDRVDKGDTVEFSPSSSSSPNRQSPAPSPANDLVVTATEVKIEGATEELEQIIRSKIKTQAGGETSQTQLQQDVAAILDTGLFINARVNSSTTPTGLNVVYQVEPVIVRSIQLSGAKALTYQVAWERFQSQVGTAISPNALKAVVEQINKWYADNGYKIARVISITPSQDGILTVNVGEGVIGSVQIRFVNEEGKTVDDKGQPVRGRTKQDFLRQQLKLKSGQLFQESVVKQDLQQLYKTGLFENVNVALEGDATKLDVIYQLKETGARSVNVGGNYSADQGIVGTLNYNDRNVGGSNDTLGVNVQVGRRDIQFESKFTSPYRASNPDRLGYSITTFRKRGLSDTFDGDVKLADGDRIREGKIGGSLSFTRPIDDWDTSLGFNYTRVSIRDREGNITPFDEQGNQLSFSGTGIDDLATVSFTATKDFRDNPSNPTSGSILKLSTEQSIPIGNGQISMNRIKANYTQFQPIQLFESKKPQVFALNLQAGTVLGDLPPYETFNLGGPNSVRGYDGGDIGSGRTYVLASAEYRFPIPILDALGGVVFADFASDLGSGDTVLDNPGGVRNKPGTGFGYGAGLRFDSPLGLIRADFGLNDQGESRLHFGIGQRF
ncbi:MULTISPECIES: BamA/TamA family outer membrane protein [Nostocales]|uniref:BamA/TamA family outer membrane protein n=2 Tax=Nostocales TaxID=1161 RepID=A0A0C1QYR9_9CYAN|nr:BamA/TamA family outer membrane protein [Tolypothrix bouteillei]KAF3886647.1 BamA/TamA family outer membrane protein [Tolypothrix bouteillei VB521301]